MTIKNNNKTQMKNGIIVLFIFITTTVFGQVAKYSNEFLSVGVGISH